jgi:hypothetical protein
MDSTVDDAMALLASKRIQVITTYRSNRQLAPTTAAEPPICTRSTAYLAYLRTAEDITVVASESFLSIRYECYSTMLSTPALPPRTSGRPYSADATSV